MAEKKRAVFSLSLSGRINLNLHDLNNEEVEGNQQITRFVTIVDKTGRPYTVSAVSGDMFKHILCAHFQRTAIEEGIPLCAGCLKFDANRICIDGDFLEKIGTDKKKGQTKDQGILTDQIIKMCALDDIAGNLITARNLNLARKSITEFGWLAALPENYTSESKFHVKFSRAESEEKGENIGQNIFYRPVNSGVYATVTNIEVFRLGLNDITRKYAIDDKERENRYKALLLALMETYTSPEGAQTNTQKPHITGFEGVITASINSPLSSPLPSPLFDPLDDGYITELERIVKNFNDMGRAVELHKFSNLAEFTDIMKDFYENTTPFKIKEAE
ncbi:MAG: DevR family CRISPR-associated autoregulator [Candidatus Coatesbacteria bacterium]|nr:MAG: DevR family CRISPR-associated autoregulator [Candidatus Coatesbacteria bacterium]